MGLRPEVHPFQSSCRKIPEQEEQSGYADLLDNVQRHARCSANCCLGKRSNETELKSVASPAR